MASITKMTGKPRKDPKTGKPLKPVTSYKLRWYYPMPGGKAEEQTVTWRQYGDITALKLIVESRGGRVRKTDPDVLDRSIITGKQTRTDSKPFGPTVSEVIDKYIAQKVKEGRKPSTISGYSGANCGGLVREFWGDEYVSQLIVPLKDGDEGEETDRAQALLDYITKEKGLDHRAPMQFAKGLLNFAVRKRYLTANPIPLLTMPDLLPHRPRFLEQEEFELMLSYVPEDDQFWLLMVAAWETGMRLGELLALERDDITVVNQRAYITVSRTTTEVKGEGIITVPPKNGKDRVVVVDVDLAETLLAPGRHEQRIFTGIQSPKTYLRRAYVNQRMRRIVELARAGKVVTGTGKTVRLTGKPPVFHSLRHSHISNQLGEGVDLFVVSKRVGHSSVQITADVYGHLQKKTELPQLAAMAAHRVAGRNLKSGGYALQVIPDAA